MFESKGSCSKFIITSETENVEERQHEDAVFSLTPVIVDSYKAFFDDDRVELTRDYDENALVLRDAKPNGPYWFSL